MIRMALDPALFDEKHAQMLGQTAREEHRGKAGADDDHIPVTAACVGQAEFRNHSGPFGPGWRKRRRASPQQLADCIPKGKDPVPDQG